MKIIERKVYYCEYCKYKSLSASVTSRHEKYCFNKPENHHKCFDFCIHLKKERVDNGFDYNNEIPKSKIEFTCLKTGKKMYSFIAEKKGIVFHLGKDVERMPLSCHLFEEHEPIEESEDYEY